MSSVFEPSTAHKAGTVMCHTVLGTLLSLYRVSLRRQKPQKCLIPCLRTQAKRLKIHICALTSERERSKDCQ